MRPTLLLGPGDRRLSSCRLVADLLRGRVPLCPSGGLSFVDVRDAADAFFSAMAVDEPRGSYLLGAVNMTLRCGCNSVLPRIVTTDQACLQLYYRVLPAVLHGASTNRGVFLGPCILLTLDISATHERQT